MRRLLLVLLLAGAGSPALAAPDADGSEDRAVVRSQRAKQDQSDSDSRQPERPAVRPQHRSEPSDGVGRPDRAQRPALVGGVDEPSPGRVVNRPAGDTERSLRPEPDNPVERKAAKEVRPVLPDRPTVERGGMHAVGGATVRGLGQDTDVPVERKVTKDRRPVLPERPASIEERNVRTAPNVREGTLVEPRRPLPRVLEPVERRVSPTPVFGTEPPPPGTVTDRRAQPDRRWSTGWRNDRRYDWRDWRRRHRNWFNLGWYYDPFGWDYFRYGVGWRMWPSYYGNSFWLRDPWRYRLPPAYGPYRWVRYHYDAVLVNIYTGQVVDIVYDFFW